MLGISLLVRPACVRVCDVALLGSGSSVHHPISIPPLLCVEVLSSEDRLDHVQQVLRDYVTMGVENVWLIDPLKRQAWTFDRDGLHPGGPSLRVTGTAITIHASTLFDE